MDKLALQFTEKGFTYRQLKRNAHAVIYAPKRKKFINLGMLRRGRSGARPAANGHELVRR